MPHGNSLHQLPDPHEDWIEFWPAVWFFGKLLLILAVIIWWIISPSHAQTACSVPPNAPGTPIVSTQTEGSHVLKAGPGCIISGYVTVAGTAGFLMIFNSTTVPSDGAVTPQNCVEVSANQSIGLNWAPQPSEWYSTGISAAFSSTGCFTKTTSATAFFHALVQ